MGISALKPVSRNIENLRNNLRKTVEKLRKKYKWILTNKLKEFFQLNFIFS